MPFREGNRHMTFSILVMVTGLVLVLCAVQLWAFDRASDRRLERIEAAASLAEEQATTAKETVACLNKFSDDLIDTLRISRDATKRIEAASVRKDAALDRLLSITRLTRLVPPEATARDFDRALAARVVAQRRFDRIKEEVDRVRDRNPYVAPKATCDN